MSLLESILYGLISGFTEFLPVSSQAHQAIYMKLTGVDIREPGRDLLVHIAVILALFTGCGTIFSRIRREQKLNALKRHGRTYASRGLYDLRLVRTATVPLLIGLLLYISTRQLEFNLVYMALLFALNGIILIVPEYMHQANKDGRSMTGLDGIIIGLCGALSALPGISRIGAMRAYALGRGVDKQYALTWALLLSVPALLLYCGFDILTLFTSSIGTVSIPIIFGYILSALSAYCGGYFSIILIQFLTVRNGFAGFAYYSWGTSLFTLILYLIA